MPTLKFRTAATIADTLASKQFRDVPAGGAVLNVWLSTVTITDTWGLSIGPRIIAINGSVANIEASTGVVDTARDQVVFNELVPQGTLQMPMTVTTAMNALIVWKPIIPQ